MSNKSYHFTKQGSHDNQGGETKVMKKILSVALSTAMAFSMFASVAFGAEAEKKLTTQEKYDFLKEEGIFTGYKDGTAGLDKTMTRAEFATVVARLLDLDLNSSTVSYNDKLSGGGVYNTEYWAHGAIEAVTAAGLMQGKNAKAKLFDPNGDVTVEEMAKVLVLALDIEVPAEEPGANWSKHYVAAAVEAGLIPAGSELKAPALRSLLVDASYAAFQAIEDAKLQPKEVKVVDATHIEVTFTDGEVVKVELEKALEANKETEVKVTHPNGKEYTVKATYVVTAAQKIESVKADNLKEIVVAFDGEVDEKSATYESNYSIEGFEIDSISLSEDNKTATILLKDSYENSLDNQKEYELSVSNVRNSDESKTFNEKVKFKPVDITLPSVKEVVGLGTKAFKVVFSEPVKQSTVNTTSNFKVDGKSVSGYVKYNYPNVAIISTELSVGDHKLEVTNVEDFANLKVIPQDLTFTVAEDTVAPEVVSAKTKDVSKVEIFFNEPVKSVNKAYHTSSSKEALTIDVNDNKVTLEFAEGDALSLGENTIYLEGVSDYSNNSANREVKVTPELDNERPYVAKVKTETFDNDSKYRITVEFSKKVNSNDATDSANYTLKDKDGKVVSGKGFNSKGHPNEVKLATKDNDGKKKYVIETSGKLDSGVYTLEISGIRDQAAVANTMLPYSAKIDINDVNRPVISTAWFKQKEIPGGKYESEIWIEFDKALAVEGSGKADDVNKYNITGVLATNTNDNDPIPTVSDLDGKKYTPLPKDTKVELVNARTVKLTLPRSSDSQLVNQGAVNRSYFGVRVINVADTSGNMIANSIDYALVRPESKLNLAVDSVEATSNDTLKVKFTGILSSINQSDFSAAGYEVSLSSYSNSDGKTEATFKLRNAKLPANVKDVDGNKLQFKTLYTNSQNEFGVHISTGSNDIEDKIKPDYVSNSLTVPYTSTSLSVGSVTKTVYHADVKFNEEINVNDINNVAKTVKVKVNNEDATVVLLEVKQDELGKNTVLRAYYEVPANKLGRDNLVNGDYIDFILESHNSNSKAVTDGNNNAATEISTGKKVVIPTT